MLKSTTVLGKEGGIGIHYSRICSSFDRDFAGAVYWLLGLTSVPMEESLRRSLTSKNLHLLWLTWEG